MSNNEYVTGVERFFDENDIIVSKTDLKGRITYANKVFLDVSGYAEAQCIGEPHSMIRHPSMPRCIFALLWDTIQSGREIFAYVVNRAINGDHYWVYAHVTPSLTQTGEIVGYHSNRRVPNRRVLEQFIVPLYADLRAAEQQHTNRKQGLQTSKAMVTDLLAEKGVAYDEFILTLDQPGTAAA